MRWLEISTNIGCVNNCEYCPQKIILNSYSCVSKEYQMSFGNFKKCIDKVPIGVKIIFSGMSEAWLNKDCTRMVMYAHSKGHEIIIYTSLIGMKSADIKCLKKIKFAYKYGFVVHLPSEGEIEEFKLDENYFNTLKALLKSEINAEFHIHGRKIHPKIRPIISKCSITPLQNRAGNIKLKNHKLNFKRGRIKCVRGLKANFLLPNGDVLLCCQDYGMKHKLGNLITDNYESLFKGEEYQKILRGMESENIDTLCRTCDAYSKKISKENDLFFYGKSIIKFLVKKNKVSYGSSLKSK